MSEPVDVVDKTLYSNPFTMRPERLWASGYREQPDSHLLSKDAVEYTMHSKRNLSTVVEDLLEKTTRYRSRREETSTAMGEEVKTVLVDGKEFWKDPKLATKTFHRSAVDKCRF
jgi:hypothetical protein